jgi:hypothetical protein
VPKLGRATYPLRVVPGQASARGQVSVVHLLVATINHERMPVLLRHEEEFETWLNGSPEDAFALAREYPPERMCIVQEGFEKKDLLRAAA